MSKRTLSSMIAVATALASTAAAAQVPADKLMVPPADAQSFVIVSAAGQHGTTAAWCLPDGSYASRFSMNLRGQLFETDEVVHIGPNGQPDRIVVRGFTPSGDAAETFEITNGKAHWKNKIEDATVTYDGKAQYSTYGGTPAALAYFAPSLYHAPGRRLQLLPGGEERLVKLAPANMPRTSISTPSR